MQIPTRVKNQHLLWRAGFGPMAEHAADLDDMSQRELWELLLKASEQKPQKLETASGMLNGLVKGVQGLVQLNALSKEQKRSIRQQSRSDIKNLNLQWLNEMISSDAQFRERMSLFWHGHFACRVVNIFFQQQLLDIIRDNALGKFGDLLKAVSKSPAMLQFLNNQQNRKQHPNENFAREVMELFTMGTGSYTEHDVKEAARAFTGWGFNLQGEFVYRNLAHDQGSKTFLGKTGNFDGDDIIDILLEQRQTATFITGKIYRHFVNETVDSEKWALLAKSFYGNDYDIRELMEHIFMNDWFYDEKNIGAKIKSPLDLLVGIRRMIPIELQNDAIQLLFQRSLGQVLFYPPNVAGWSGGKTWIDSSTLMLRLRIPQILTNNETVSIRPKSDDDIMMGRMTDEEPDQKAEDHANKKPDAMIDWKMVINIFGAVPQEKLLDKIAQTVLQTKSRVSNKVLAGYINTDSREQYIKTAIIYLMSTPEYQLC